MTKDRDFESWEDEFNDELDEEMEASPESDIEEDPPEEIDPDAEDEEDVVEAEEPHIDPPKKNPTMKILLWTGLVLLSGFVLIVGWFLFMVPGSAPTANQGPVASNQIAGQVERNTQGPQNSVAQQQRLSVGIDQNEVAPVPISEIPSQDLPESLRPQKVVDPLTGIEQSSSKPSTYFEDPETYEAPATAEQQPEKETQAVGAQVQNQAMAEQEALLGRMEQMQKILEEHSQRIDQLLGLQQSQVEDQTAEVADSGEAQAQVQAEEQSQQYQAAIAELEKENSRLAQEIRNMQATINNLKAEQKDLVSQNEKLEGANGWLRKLHKEQARQIETLKKEALHLLSKPILPGWKIVGMTDREAIFSDDYRLLRLKVGNTFAGVTVKDVDVANGVVKTNYGEIKYVKD